MARDVPGPAGGGSGSAVAGWAVTLGDSVGGSAGADRGTMSAAVPGSSRVPVGHGRSGTTGRGAAGTLVSAKRRTTVPVATAV